MNGVNEVINKDITLDYYMSYVPVLLNALIVFVSAPIIAVVLYIATEQPKESPAVASNAVNFCANVQSKLFICSCLYTYTTPIHNRTMD